MKWDEVRKRYPNQYVKLQILQFHIDKGKKYIDDVAVIESITDARRATQELVRSSTNELVYHTGNETIFVELKDLRGYRSVLDENGL